MRHLVDTLAHPDGPQHLTNLDLAGTHIFPCGVCLVIAMNLDDERVQVYPLVDITDPEGPRELASIKISRECDIGSSSSFVRHCPFVAMPDAWAMFDQLSQELACKVRGRCSIMHVTDMRHSPKGSNPTRGEVTFLVLL